MLRRLICVAAVAAVAGCAAPAQQGADGPIQLRQAPAGRLDTTLAQAEADLRAGRFESALNSFSGAVKADPTNTRASIGMGEAYLGLGNADLALRTFDTLAAEAKTPVVLQGRGIALTQKGSLDEAERTLASAVAEDASLWRAWNALGRLHDRKQAWAEADAAYRRALSVNPDGAEVYNNLGYSLLLRGKHAEAIQQFEQALKRAPGMAAAQDNLALANALLGRYDRALASTASDRMPVALNNAGFAAITRGDYNTADAYLNRAVQQSSQHFGRASENLRWLSYLRTGSKQ